VAEGCVDLSWSPLVRAWMERLSRLARACSRGATGVAFPLCYLFIRYSLHVDSRFGSRHTADSRRSRRPQRPTGPKRVCRVDKDTSSFGSAMRRDYLMWPPFYKAGKAWVSYGNAEVCPFRPRTEGPVLWETYRRLSGARGLLRALRLGVCR
jgi:hypothetical protein